MSAAAAAAKSLQSWPTLCDPIDGSPPGSSVLGILQARTLKWVDISFSDAWKWKVKGESLSQARLFATPWTAAYQAPLSMGYSRQEYWSGLPLPSLGLSYMAFIMLRYVPSMPALWRVCFFLIMNGCWILWKAFSAFIEIIIWVLSFRLLIWCITLIDLGIFKNSGIPGI